MISTAAVLLASAVSAQEVPADYLKSGVRPPGQATSATPTRTVAPLDFLKGGVIPPGTIRTSVPTIEVRPSPSPGAAAPASLPAPGVRLPMPPSAVAAGSGLAAGAPSSALPPLPPECIAKGVDTILTPACMRFLSSEPPRLARLGAGGGPVPPMPPTEAAAPGVIAAPVVAAVPPPLPVAVAPAVASLRCSVSGPRGREDPMTVLNPESCLRIASVAMPVKGVYSVLMVGSDGSAVVVGCDVRSDGDAPSCAVRP